MSLRDFFSYTLRLTIYFSLLLITILITALLYLQNSLLPELPDVNSIKDIRMQVPLRIYTKDNAALAEFGKERRTPLVRKDIPESLIQAILAAEDARFYEHIGVDMKGLIRALVNFLKTQRKEQGASTITMQLARNIFDEKIGSEKTFKRKFKEMLTAIQIERSFSKDDILELYLNKIFLGHRSYGMAAASQVYYGKTLKELSLAQYAMLAGLPKAPSKYNPLSNPERSLIRRNYILKRMHELGFINETQRIEAQAEPVSAQRYTFSRDFDAPYIAEMVRMFMRENYPDDTYTGGYKVYTTVDTRLQGYAQQALRNTVLNYDHRHGYRGAMEHVNLADLMLPENLASLPVEKGELPLTQEDIWLSALDAYQPYVDLQPALVLAVEQQIALVYSKEGQAILLEWEALSWARRYISDTRQGYPPKQASDVLSPGDIVMIQPIPEVIEKETEVDTETPDAPVTEATSDTTKTEDTADTEEKPQKWRLSQVPKVSGALVSLDSKTGAILALTGGFNYYSSKFNRVIQAKRQPGSNFKPFVYSAALEHGYTPASIINDAPMVFRYGRKVWKPENYGHKFNGPIRLRKALAKSKNLVSVRLIEDVGLNKTLDYVSRFGFNPKELPHNLTLSLGTPELTPLQIVSGFAVLSNGGYRVDPYFIERIENYTGEVIYQANPAVVCDECDMPLDPPLIKEDDLELTGLAALLAEDEAEKARLLQGNTPDSPIFHPHQAPPHQPRYAPRVILPQNAWLMTSILKSVIIEGTATRAKRLKRDDLAGKTGTTNEQRDAWFSGFNHAIVTTAWMGFDQPRSLGKTINGRETGSSAALPMWMAFMKQALQGTESQNLPMPAGIVRTRIDPDSGLLARSDQDNAMVEYFRKGSVPRRYAQRTQEQYLIDIEEDVGAGTDQLF